MRKRRRMHVVKMICCGAILMQAGGCANVTAIDYIQTVLLGITAAGGVAILRNI